MKLRRITNPEEVCVDKLISLYIDSFPAEERRNIESLKYLIKTQPQMYFNTIECDGVLCGLFVYWKFETFYYLEHLAVYPEMRNHKIGQQVLDFVKDNLKGVRLLEVEPADNDMAVRRVNYYQRNGYQVLDRNYIQPSYDGVRDAIPLWIMGNEPCEDKNVLEDQVNTIVREVYIKNRELV